MWMSCFRMISRQTEWGRDLYAELRLILCAYSLEFAWENTNWANSLCAKVSNRSVKTQKNKFCLTAVCFWFRNEIVWNLWVTVVWEQNMLTILTDEIIMWLATFPSSYNHTDWPPIDSVLMNLSMWLQADRSVWWAWGKIYTATHCHHDIAAIHFEQMTEAYLNFTSLANTAQY